MEDKFEPFKLETAVFDIQKVSFDSILNTSNPIIFDTNFLFITFEFRIDLISELKKTIGHSYNLFIYEGTIDELKSVEKKGDKNKKFLPLIVKMLHLYNFKIIKSDIKYVDKQVLLNLNQKVLIATNDKILKQKIQEKGFHVIYTRQKSYLEKN